MPDPRFLPALWFVLITVLFSGFFFLEGFDYGVGIMLPFVGKTEKERGSVMASIGPFWDGNEVWMITAGGAIFAAFPQWYATLFSGMYLALVVVLVLLILRGVSFEFRNNESGAKWRSFWDWTTFVTSLLLAVLWGVALSNILEGVAIWNQGSLNIAQYGPDSIANFLSLLNPFAILGGVATLCVFALHGATFLSLKTTGEVEKRANAIAKLLAIPTAAVVTLFVAWGVFTTHIMSNFNFDYVTIYPTVNPIPALLVYVVAALAAVTMLGAVVFIFMKKFGSAFISMALFIVLSTVTGFLGMFPNVMVSNATNPTDVNAWFNNSLNILNARSSDYTLHAMTIVALCLVPVVLIYQGWNYYIFRKRVSSDSSY